MTGHLVWDVKMDLTRKARWVLDGHKTADPVGSTYAGVVSRESVRIAFTYAALNGLNICAAESAGPVITEGLYNLWTRVWFGKCWKSCAYTSCPLWRQSCGPRFQKSSEIMNASLGVHSVSS